MKIYFEFLHGLKVLSLPYSVDEFDFLETFLFFILYLVLHLLQSVKPCLHENDLLFSLFWLLPNGVNLNVFDSFGKRRNERQGCVKAGSGFSWFLTVFGVDFVKSKIYPWAFDSCFWGSSFSSFIHWLILCEQNYNTLSFSFLI